MLTFNKHVVAKLIVLYQYFIRPYLPPSCRFGLSCSEYTKLAIIKYGVVKGGFLGIARLLRCQPFFNYQNLK